MVTTCKGTTTAFLAEHISHYCRREVTPTRRERGESEAEPDQLDAIQTGIGWR